MIQNAIAHPNIVGRDEWLTARKALLEHEKELTKQRDRIQLSRQTGVRAMIWTEGDAG